MLPGKGVWIFFPFISNFYLFFSLHLMWIWLFNLLTTTFNFFEWKWEMWIYKTLVQQGTNRITTVSFWCRTGEVLSSNVHCFILQGFYIGCYVLSLFFSCIQWAFCTLKIMLMNFNEINYNLDQTENISFLWTWLFFRLREPVCKK